MNVCNKCGKENKSNALFCVYCGTKITVSKNDVQGPIYELFGVSSDVSDEVLEAAYKNLLKKIEPLKIKEPEKYKYMAEKIKQCYETLLNPEKRRKYDELLKSGEIERTASQKAANTKQAAASNNVAEHRDIKSNKKDDEDIWYEDLPSAIKGTIFFIVVMIAVHKFIAVKWATALAIFAVAMSAGMVVTFLLEKLYYSIKYENINTSDFNGIAATIGGIFAKFLFDYYVIVSWYTKLWFVLTVIGILGIVGTFIADKLN